MMLKIKFIATFSFILLAAFIFLETSLMRNTMATGFISSAQKLSGKDLFKNNCARCHGADGTGGKGPNLTTEKLVNDWLPAANSRTCRPISDNNRAGVLLPFRSFAAPR